MFKGVLCVPLVWGLAFPQAAHGSSCDNVLSEDSIHIAISSDERGYRKAVEADLFHQFVERAIRRRAEEICKISKCHSLASYEVGELDAEKPILAKIPKVKVPELIFSKVRESDLPQMLPDILDVGVGRQPEFEEVVFKGKRLWVFGNIGSKRFGNGVWNLGRSLMLAGAFSTLTGPLAIILGPVLGGTGGIVTAVSRVVERKPREITPEHALLRLENRKKISKIYDWFGKRVPHLIFKKVQCREIPLVPENSSS